MVMFRAGVGGRGEVDSKGEEIKGVFERKVENIGECVGDE